MSLIQKLKSWWDVGTVDPGRDEAMMPVLLLWVERLSILVVAIVSGIAVAAYGYLMASGYTSIELVRWLAAAVFFAIATAITDVGVKYFVQKGAFDFFAAFNPRTYKDSKASWGDVVIIVSAGILTLTCFHYCEVEKFIKDLIDSEWGRIAARYVVKVLLFCIFIPISELSFKSFLQVKENGRYTWFQRSMQVVVWACMIGMIGGLFYFDYISVESVRRPVANMVKQEKQINQDSIRNIVLAQESARVGATKGAIQYAESAIRQLEKDVLRAEIRVAANNSELDGINKGKKNGWELQELARRKNAATASLRNQIEKERENLTFLRQQQGKELEYSRTIVSRSDSATFAINAAIAGRNTDLVTGTSTMFIWLGFWAKCIAGLIRVLLVAMFMGGNIQDYNGDGQVDYKDVTAAAPMGFRPA